MAIVAQLVRASVCGTEGRGFKPRRSPQFSHISETSIIMMTPEGLNELHDLPDFDEHEDVHFVNDDESGLKAIIAIHSTHLGPAAGGARFWH